ncbi:MAG TPA: hypothetical protein VF082_12755 [Jiangellaceae bacterium]
MEHGTEPRPERAYPLTVPNDPRFTVSLLLDVRKVLADHGYPHVTEGADLLDLQACLFRFLYGGGR